MAGRVARRARALRIRLAAAHQGRAKAVRGRLRATPRWPRGVSTFAALVAVLLGLVMLAAAAGSATNEAPHDHNLASDPEIRALRERLVRQQAEREARRHSPEARAERDRSRYEFANASSDRALAIAKAKFPQPLLHDVWEELKLRPGERIARYDSPHAIRVSRGEGPDAVVQSNVPVLAEDEQGDKRPVELALEEHGAGFRSRNPLVRVTFAKGARAGARFDRSGIGVRLADSEDVPAAEVADKVFFPNARRDLDFWFTPTDGGASTNALLRSAESPETLALEFDLPTGSSVRQGSEPHGSAAIVRDGQVLARISPPLAYDADDEPVRVAAEVNGNTLVLSVPHRAGDYEYPIHVDPYIIEYSYWNDTGVGIGQHGWQGNTARWDSFNLALKNDASFGAGLYIETKGGGWWYNDLDLAEWYLRPHRPGIHFPRIDVQTAHSSSASTCVQVGVWRPTTYVGNARAWRCDNYSGWWPTLCAASDCNWDVGDASAHATFNLFMLGSGSRQAAAKAAMRRAAVFLWDKSAPVNSLTAFGTRPWKHDDVVDLGGKGTDYGGIGMRKIAAYFAGTATGSVAAENTTCDGTRFKPCPEELAFPAGSKVDSSTRGEGHSTVLGAVEENTERSVVKTLGTMRIDRSAPAFDTATFGGPLWTNREKWVKDGVYDVSWRPTDSHSGIREHRLGIKREAADPESSLAIRDDFSRSATNGWGTAELGGPWTAITSPGAGYSVDGKEGLLENAATSGEWNIVQREARLRDFDARVSTRLHSGVAGTGQLTWLLMARVQNDNSHTRVGYYVDPSKKVWIAGNNGAGTPIFSSFDTGMTYAPGDRFWLRVRMEGANPTRTRVKLWRVGSAEPTGWQIDSTSTVGQQVSGAFGVRSYNTTSTPATMAFDDLTAEDVGTGASVRRDGRLENCDTVTQCPTAYSASGPPTLKWDSRRHAEGSREFRLGAFDALDHGTATDWFTVKLDRSLPKIVTGSESGTLIRRQRGAGKQTLNFTARDDFSGVHRVELLIDDASDPSDQPVVVDTEPGTCSSTGCAKDLAATLEWNPQNGPADANVTARLYDQVGHHHDKVRRSIGDGTPPTIDETVTGPLHDKVFHKESPEPLRAKARDADCPEGESGEVGVEWIRLLIGSERARRTVNDPARPNNCELGGPLAFDVADPNPPSGPLPEGRHNVSLEAQDYAGNRATKTTRKRPGDLLPTPWEIVVDRSAPEVDPVTGTLKTAEGTTLYSGAYTLHVNSRDGDATSRQTERSGVTETRVYVDSNPDDADPGIEQQPHLAEQPCPTGSCPMHRPYTFMVEDWGPGDYVVRVRVRDQVGNRAQEQTVNVRVGSLLSDVNDKTGLEQYFHYDVTPTGAGTDALVNLANGNLVWHSQLHQVRGRGLSTGANLTYNSQARLPNQSWPFAYAQAGPGFSLGVSGLTRLNEPLVDLGGAVMLTDADGTRHEFTLRSDGVSYRPPAGVNLHLRRFSPALPDPTVPPDPEAPNFDELVEDFNQHWAATDPTGVTHFFDLRGYQTAIEDRNGNRVEFRYRDIANLLEECPLVRDAICKVNEVVDAEGRSLQVIYDAIIPDGTRPPPPDEGDPAPVVREKVRNLGAWGAHTGRVQAIVDQAGRRTNFTYDQILGTLESVDQAVGTGHDQRTWTFGYTNALALQSVTDPNGSATQFTYGTYPKAPFGAELEGLERTSSVTDRRSARTSFEYDALATDDPLRAMETTVTNALGAETAFRLDGRGRMRRETDALGTVDTVDYDPDNNVQQLIRARDTRDQTVTSMEHNPNGMLTTHVNPEGETTTLEYRDGAGRHLSELPSLQDPLGPSADANGRFVSDLDAEVTPRRHRWDYVLDGRGNVTARTDPEQNTARTEYDDFGRITCERDERGRRTLYGDFHVTGQPQTVVDPVGTDALDNQASGDCPTVASAVRGRWGYTYDAAGNVLSVRDPRGSGHNDGRYTTTLTYNAFDQKRTERRPMRSDPERYPNVPDDERFASREWQYDDNGNQRFYRDGTARLFETKYTATDQVDEERTPAFRHLPASSDEPATASAVTKHDYDRVGNQIQVTTPVGQSSATEDDWSTEYAYDALNRRIVERRVSAEDGARQERVTSYAYDRRDNLVGLADPRHNARQGCVAEPEDGGTPSAEVTACRRFTYEYDGADRRTAQVEDPGGEALRTDSRYDDNGNVDRVTDPRRNSTDYAYDGRDQLTVVSDPLGRRTRRTYFPDGQVQAETSPKGTASAADGDYTTRYTYDAAGRLRTRSLPWDPDQYGMPAQKDPNGADDLVVTYTRNAVGDPTTIRDARGHSITNEFFDGGELRSTTRPSWFTVEGDGVREKSDQEMGGSDGEGQMPSGDGKGDLGGVEPQQTPGLLPRAGETLLDLDGEGRLTAVTERNGDNPIVTRLRRNELGLPTAVDRPFNGATRSVETFDYDLNGNVRRTTDAADNATTVRYTQFNEAASETRPGSNQGEETTRHEYDPNGNVDRTVLPRGDQFVIDHTYDALDRVSAVTTPWGAADDQPEQATQTTEYDAAGNIRLVRSPRGHGLPDAGACVSARDADQRFRQRRCFETHFTYNAANERTSATDGFGNRTTFGYDDNGNQTLVRAPGARRQPGEGIADEEQVTRRTFDGRDLPWAETTGQNVDGVAERSQRTRVTEYDANRNVVREVNPRGVDEATRRPTFAVRSAAAWEQAGASEHAAVHSYDPDGLRTETREPWGNENAADQRRYRQTFEYNGRGLLTGVLRAHLAEEADSEAKRRRLRTSYSHYDNGWIREATDPEYEQAENRRQRTTYCYDARGLQTRWSTRTQATTAGDPCAGTDNNALRDIQRQYWPSGRLQRRIARHRRDEGGARRTREYEYDYNRNGSMTELRDEQQDRTTGIAYDAADRERVVNEDWDGGNDTFSLYDENGNVTHRSTDGEFEAVGDRYDGGKTSVYHHDPLDREIWSSVNPEANNERTRVTETYYWDSGEWRAEWRGQLPADAEARPRDWTEHLADGQQPVIESHYFYNDGKPSQVNRQRRGQQEGSLKQQHYRYDRNGNRIQDERGTHGYNSRDQQIRWTRANRTNIPAGLRGTSVNYTLNGFGAQETATDEGHNSTSRFEYDGDRLMSTTTTGGPNAGTRNMGYDEFGSATATGDPIPAGVAPCADESNGPGNRFSYDEFGRMTCAIDAHGRQVRYTYDALDRRDTATRNGRRSQLRYVGMTEMLSQEQAPGTNQGAKTETFDYSSDGALRGTARGDDDHVAQYRSYSFDANESIEGLEQANGEVADNERYEYDPYGQLQANAGEQRPGQGLSEAAADNPFRFQGFYEDEGVGTYDMQARPYAPNMGRFLTQDRFEDPNRDLAIQSDPLTQGRYTFAGGNPTSRVEFDGHFSGNEGGAQMCMRGQGCRRSTRRERRARQMGPSESWNRNQRRISKSPTAQRNGDSKSVERGAPNEEERKQIQANAAKHWIAENGFEKDDSAEGFFKGAAGGGVELAKGTFEMGRHMPSNPYFTYTLLEKGPGGVAGYWGDQAKGAHHAATNPDETWEALKQRYSGAEGKGRLFVDVLAIAATRKLPVPKAAPRRGRGPSSRPAPCSSFLPSTPVLLADGRRIAIEDVRVGDMVLATDPRTGETRARKVTDLITSAGPKRLVKLTVAGKTTIATANHPYYLADERRWVKAAELKFGDRLRRPDGTVAIVERAERFTVIAQRVHNFTVEGDHTYYAGATAVLVHNAPRCGSIGAQRENRVAAITGGKVQGTPGSPGMAVVQPGVGRTDVDVVGPRGEFIAVGGPAKASNLSDLGRRMSILRYAASERGVEARAYFEKGTPNEALKIAQRHLGPGNVRTFDP